jgi:hypothetical protein
MAREVWGDDSGKPWHESAVTHLEAFAALVAAAEREACLDLCYTIGGEFKEDWAEHNEDKYWERCLGAGECADAIRARGCETTERGQE